MALHLDTQHHAVLQGSLANIDHVVWTICRVPDCVQMLLSGLKHSSSDSQSAAGWLAASELLLEEHAPEAALDAAKQVRTEPAHVVWYEIRTAH